MVKNNVSTAEVQVIKKTRARASAKLESEQIEIPYPVSPVNASPKQKQQTKPADTDQETVKQAPPTQPLTRGISTILCIPAYNEEKEIGPLIIKAKKYVDQVIVCDDGSEDSMGEIAKGLGATVIRHETSLGRTASLRTLLELSQELDPAMTLILDINLRYDVSEIPKIVSTMNTGTADVVLGRSHPEIDNEDDLNSIFIGFSRKGLKAFLLAPPETIESHSKIMGIAQDNLLYFKEVPTKALSEANETISMPQPMEAELPTTINVQNQLITVESSKSDGGIYQRAIGALIYKSLIFFGFPGFLSLAIGILAGAYVITTFMKLNYLSLPAAFIMLIGVISGLFLLITTVILAAFSRLNTTT